MNYIHEIKELKKRKLNNSEIAEHLGISQSQVRKLLNGEYEELNENSYSPYTNDLYGFYSNDDSDVNDILKTVRGEY
jgi:transcriptional regulator with XRE-family HTH domain